MVVVNNFEFRAQLDKFLDDVEKKNETLVIKRGKGKGAVVISLEEYYSIMKQFVYWVQGKMQKGCLNPFSKWRSREKR